MTEPGVAGPSVAPRPELFVYLRSSVQPFNIDESLMARLRADFPQLHVTDIDSLDTLEARIGEPHILLTWHFKAEWYDRATNLRAILTPAAGKDWVDDDPRGRIPVCHGRFHGRLMAESLLGLILFFNRRMDRLLASQARHEWNRSINAGSRLLSGQHVVFLGYGKIARHCARLLKTFGVRMSGMQRRHAEGSDPETGLRYFTPEKLLDTLPSADHLVAVLPGDASTTDLLTRRHFEAISPSAYLYNIGRGNCYDEEVLIEALANGRIAGAGLDVFAREPLRPDSPLWDMDNVVITPHASAVYQEYLPLYYEEARVTLGALLRGARSSSERTAQ